MKPATLARLNAARRARQPVLLATWLDDGSERLIFPGEELEAWLAEAVAGAFARDRSTTLDHGGRALFLHVFAPPPRLVVAGAVHIAQPLAAFASRLGWEVTVVDPRRAFADPARFAGAKLVCAWPDDALAGLQLCARSAVVALAHDPRIDDPALHAALASPAFHIGALGSRRSHAKRVARLRQAGFDAAAIARIRGPVGLDIGAATPGEIALATMAEAVAALRAGRA